MMGLLQPAINIILLVSESPSPSFVPEASPTPMVADGPSQNLTTEPPNRHHRSYHLTLIPGLGIAVAVVAVMMLLVLVILIRRKSRELKDCENIDNASSKTFPPPRSVRKFQEGKVCCLPWLYPYCC